MKKKLTSALEPRLCAKGSVTKDGTKNTGNHFAKTALPGSNNLYNPSPNSALMDNIPSSTLSYKIYTNQNFTISSPILISLVDTKNKLRESKCLSYIEEYAGSFSSFVGIQ